MYVDNRLDGIQAVQALLRMNRSYDGSYRKKTTTFVLDFMNDPAEVLAAFKLYYETAELENVTGPNLMFDLKGKLNSTGYYDEFEVNRAVDLAVKAQPTPR